MPNSYWNGVENMQNCLLFRKHAKILEIDVTCMTRFNNLLLHSVFTPMQGSSGPTSSLWQMHEDKKLALVLVSTNNLTRSRNCSSLSIVSVVTTKFHIKEETKTWTETLWGLRPDITATLSYVVRETSARSTTLTYIFMTKMSPQMHIKQITTCKHRRIGLKLPQENHPSTASQDKFLQDPQWTRSLHLWPQ